MQRTSYQREIIHAPKWSMAAKINEHYLIVKCKHPRFMSQELEKIFA